MIRKEINAITFDEMRGYLEEKGLLQEFINGNIKCVFCNSKITDKNIFAIYYSTKISFCCDNELCVNVFKKREALK